MTVKAQIMDEAQLRRCLARMTHEIIEKNRGVEDLCLIGVHRRGIPLARMLAENLLRFEGTEVPVGRIDITRYRDDLTAPRPEAVESCIPCALERRTAVIVDDVICTGRTARAAIDAILAHGRPRAIQLAVLVDRGHRELPIRPDYVGKNVPTARDEIISVLLEEVDGRTGVQLLSP
ncbi:MAG: bifunctional pyr operon transcriptional regulator/uracil phosphoribosyltransferase PyrR [Ruminococcaceae bacterium]|jgi:pyrimidine operon attenuation protein/uracil phosphoribosyltransferase|nr:bifunctional pyr operon transcriptional regulator/uracil phosphoribosyltransferase PyrR [Oscillospiraceae bacterium]